MPKVRCCPNFFSTSIRILLPQNPQLLQTGMINFFLFCWDVLNMLVNINSRYVNHAEAVADAIQRLWPIFKAIFDLRAWDNEVSVQMQVGCEFTH
ncbi:hypothetical protein PRUPE_6G220700 [Prunus persica]|uniref:Uncharacterized protein n=1 Tax=Prunus persica TaxID=3760 RepID=A0A251NU28_PRUPE|nr:hypothetical protein PRUPE_6G220700 [Prunus persica]